jgi:DNA primase
LEKQELWNKFVVACQHMLKTKNSYTARQYLKNRLSQQQISEWKFGYFPKNSSIKEFFDIMPACELEEIGVIYNKKISFGSVYHGHFSNHNLILPFYDVYSDVVGIIGRTLLSEEDRSEVLLQKYKYNNGCRKDLNVFGLDKAKKAILEKDCVICVEGQFDCISLHSQGIENSVAVGGSNLSIIQLFKILRYTKNIIIMFDNDEAGQKSKIRLKNKYNFVKTLSPPDGFKDIDDFFRSCRDERYKTDVIDMLKHIGD